MSQYSQTETVVVGAGPAGLTAALVLARYRHPVVVVDGPGWPRNHGSAGIHGYIGLDGVTPAEMRSRVWDELSRYDTVERRDTDAERLRAIEGGGFQVGLVDGATIDAKTVLLATGVVDVFPTDVEGFAQCWGRSVIHCPFCLGEENAGGRWANVIDHAGLAALTGVAFRAWSDDTIAICPESMPGLETARETARASGGDVVAGTIRRLHHRDGVLSAVEFDDGRVVERDTLVWAPRQRQQAVVERARQEMGLTADDAGFLEVDAMQCTSVPGLYAAGDLASRWKQTVSASCASGATAADAMHGVAVMSAVHG